MFGIIAAVLFVGAAVLAIGTMVFMFRAYQDKMIAALLFQPMPEPQPVYHVEVMRRRVRPAPRSQGFPAGAALAA